MVLTFNIIKISIFFVNVLDNRTVWILELDPNKNYSKWTPNFGSSVTYLDPDPTSTQKLQTKSF